MAIVTRDKADLEILLETTTEHSDAVEAELHNKAEEIIRESETRLAQFLEAVPVDVAVFDASGTPYYANRVAQQLLGKGILPSATSEQTADVYEIYIAGTDQEYPVENLPIVRALRGESSTTDDIEIHQPEKIIPIEVWGTPTFNEHGDIAYGIIAFQDITERKQEEEALKRQVEELRIEIDHQKREREVTQITQSDYFQELQKEVTELQLDEFWS